MSSKSRFLFNGIHYVSWQRDEYELAEGEVAVGRLAATNANWVSVLTTWYQSDSQATEINPDPLRTPSDEALRCAVGRLRSHDLKIMLKPHVDALSSEWRGEFKPIHEDAWFASYSKYLWWCADFAQILGLDALVLGTELVHLSGPKYRKRWEALISDVRTRYDGLLTYAANATYATDEFSRIAFWQDLDLIGLDAYFPMVDGWSSHVPAVRRLAEHFDKPVIFTEIGYRSTAGAAVEPWNHVSAGVPDQDVQAACYRAFFEVWTPHARWMQGGFWWNWPASEARPDETGYSPCGKAAETVLAEWFSSPRSERVEEIRKRVQSGEYEIDPLKISRAIIRHHLRSDGRDQ